MCNFAVMKIGRLQIVSFKNYMLGPEWGKPVNKFYVRFGRHSISINLYNYCILITYHKRPKFNTGKSISIQEFAAVMKKRGVDLSKATPVEMSVNGITNL